MPSNFPAEMLRETALFRGLSIDEIEELLAVAEDQEHAAGANILHEGGRDRALYVIFDGEVEIVLPTPSLGETTVIKLGAGSVFGESTFFHPAPHVAVARCLTQVLAVRLPRQRFDHLLENSSLAAYKLAANAATLLAERLQSTDRWIEGLIQRHQDEEVAASWREFHRRVTFGQGLASYGPVGSFCPGAP